MEQAEQDTIGRRHDQAPHPALAHPLEGLAGVGIGSYRCRPWLHDVGDDTIIVSVQRVPA